MELNIHNDILEKLYNFHDMGKIPNIIFHGQYASGKKYLLYKILDKIYSNDKQMINKYVISVNCAHGKGIKFVREELMFFARTNINNMNGYTFKTIILYNADRLTIDAQSALRRCIELFSHSTRFFIIVEDKFRLLKPILSRFCEIHVPIPIIDGKEINLYNHVLNKEYKTNIEDKKWIQKLKKLIYSNFPKKSINEISCLLYEKGFSGLDIIQLFESMTEESMNISYSKKYKMLILFQQLKKEFRYEKLYMAILLNYILIRFDDDLENI